MNNEKITALIDANEQEFKNPDSLMVFIDNYLSDTRAIDDLDDYISEQVESDLPIYYNDIIDSWKLCQNCHGLTIEVCGEYGSKDDIYKMMTEDLYFYNEQELTEDYQTLLELLENNE